MSHRPSQPHGHGSGSARKSRGDWVFLTALIVLGALSVMLWFSDPTHRVTGESRIPWPAANP